MITPFFKKGDSRYLDNYRPVSTVHTTCINYKILEMYYRLYCFCHYKTSYSGINFTFGKNTVNYYVGKVISEIERRNMF